MAAPHTHSGAVGFSLEWASVKAVLDRKANPMKMGARPEPGFGPPDQMRAQPVAAPHASMAAAAGMPAPPKRASRRRGGGPVQPGGGGKAAFTLRLDADRHLRLRLASALHHQSAQQLVIEALDSLLKTLPDVEAMAHRLSRGADDDQHNGG